MAENARPLLNIALVDAFVRDVLATRTTLREAMEVAEREIVLAALEAHDNSHTGAAEALGYSRVGFYRVRNRAGV